MQPWNIETLADVRCRRLNGADVLVIKKRCGRRRHQPAPNTSRCIACNGIGGADWVAVCDHLVDLHSLGIFERPAGALECLMDGGYCP